MKIHSFWARQALDIPNIISALKTASFEVLNVCQTKSGLMVYLDEHESKNPTQLVESLIKTQERISNGSTINIVTAVSRVKNLPNIYRSMQASLAGTDANVRWILVFNAEEEVTDKVLRMIRECSRIKIERIIYDGKPTSYGIDKKNRGIDFIEKGFYHCLDDDNIVHPDFFRGISRAMERYPEKKAFVFNQRRWDGCGDLLAMPERMQLCSIDNAMFLVHKDLIGEDRYDPEKGGREGFYFFRKLYDKDPDDFVFLDEFLAYYNYLKHHTIPDV